MADFDPAIGDVPETKSRLEDIKYYTSLFLGTVAIVCVFTFLFLIPFILDPAISTMAYSFVEDPVHCKVTGLVSNGLREVCHVGPCCSKGPACEGRLSLDPPCDHGVPKY